jgi:alcohol dehydrogenase class IV
MNQFRFVTHAQEVIFGAGSVAKLAEAAETNGWQRLMLCTGRSLCANGTAETVQKTLGDRLAFTLGEVNPHVLAAQVNEALAAAIEHDVDAVIGLGGGSPIGMAKAISMALEAKRTGREVAHAAYLTQQPVVPSIAIPTTYAGSEMTPTYGITRTMEDGSTRKVTVSDPKIVPKLAIYDPLLTLDTPPTLTATTGINALAHCVEAMYSVKRNPLSTATALMGLRYIAGALLRCYENGNNIQARTEMLIGAHMGGTCLATVTMSLHHGTCHVLGGTAGVPHGVANSIILPHAIRFNAQAVASLIAESAEAMGIARDGQSDEAMSEAAAQFVHQLVAKFDVPQRLRDAGVAETMLPKLAENMLKSEAVRNNPRPIGSVEEALSFLRAAW